MRSQLWLRQSGVFVRFLVPGPSATMTVFATVSRSDGPGAGSPTGLIDAPVYGAALALSV